MKSWVAVALPIALLAAPALAQAPANDVVNPDWLHQPDRELIGAAYPKLAQALSLQGRAIISCSIAVSGLLENCRVVAEHPKGLGFGPAALSIRRHFQMRPKVVNGKPVAGGTVRIPVAFRLPPLPPAPPAAPAAPGPKLALAKQAAAPDDLAERAAVEFETRFHVEAPREVPARQRARAGEALKASIIEIWPAWSDSVAAVVAGALGEPELEAAAHFSRTPAGRSWAVRRPEVRRGLGLAMQRYVQAIQADAQRLFCERATCAVAPVREPDGLAPSLSLTREMVARAPIRDQMNWAAPRSVAMLRLGGEALLRCRLNNHYGLSSCGSVADSPAGMGFGAAAVRLAPFYSVKPETAEPGAPVSLLIEFPGGRYPAVEWTVPLSDAATLAAARELTAGEIPLDETVRRVREVFLGAEGDRSGDTPPQMRARVLEAIETAARQNYGRLLDEAANEVASLMTEDEIRARLAFRRTPEGRAYAEAMRRSEAEIESIDEYFGARIRAAAARRFCADFGCDADFDPAASAKP